MELAIDQKEFRTYNFPQGRVTDHRINLTLHKLEEFLSGEIHEEMNQELRLKEQTLKLRKLKFMNALELINFGAKKLRQKKIDPSRLDSELLLSKILNKKENKF